jgi:hypothetical protein
MQASIHSWITLEIFISNQNHGCSSSICLPFPKTNVNEETHGCKKEWEQGTIRVNENALTGGAIDRRMIE